MGKFIDDALDIITKLEANNRRQKDALDRLLDQRNQLINLVNEMLDRMALDDPIDDQLRSNWYVDFSEIIG